MHEPKDSVADEHCRDWCEKGSRFSIEVNSAKESYGNEGSEVRRMWDDAAKRRCKNERYRDTGMQSFH